MIMMMERGGEAKSLNKKDKKDVTTTEDEPVSFGIVLDFWFFSVEVE